MEHSWPKSLKLLWELAASFPAKSPEVEPGLAFSTIGLFLSSPLENGGYWCTPINSLAFARTGCDGEHYSFLTTNDTVSEDSPVIMTVPMNDRERTNMVVGENLADFLALGCRAGYTVLPQFSYDFEQAIRDFRPDLYLDEWQEEIELLKVISDGFHLVPWSDTRGRLTELQCKYSNKFQLPSVGAEK